MTTNFKKFLEIGLACTIITGLTYFVIQGIDVAKRENMEAHQHTKYLDSILEKPQVSEIKNIDGCQVKKHTIVHKENGYYSEVFYTATCGETETISKVSNDRYSTVTYKVNKIK